MPVYEYECLVCGKHHELMQKFNDLPLMDCPACGGHMKKLISNTSFVLKGSGWYKTDYTPHGSSKPGDADKGDSKKTEGKAESSAAPEKKTETPSSV